VEILQLHELKSSLHRLPCRTQLNSFKVKVTLRLTVSESVIQSISVGVEPHLGLMTRCLLLFDSHGLVFVLQLSWL
jgi:hypothetical protein